MKKKIALLSALGVAGAVAYALQSHNKRKNADANGEAANNGTQRSNGDKAGSTFNAKPQNNERAKAASMAKIENGEIAGGSRTEHVVDDQGTDQSGASQILRNIRDNAFDASDEKLALALGRPTEEIESWTTGEGLIDGDVIMKARTLAMQRGFEV